MALQQPQQNITISVERLLEREVDQIARNGEETYIKPFTLSEELSYFASKIDFHGTHEDVLQADDDSKSDLDEERKKQKEADGETNTESRWPWETVHSKLRIALSEVCVMLDVLECLHRKKYLVLDPIQQNPEPNKQTVQMLGSRKCLAQVGALIAKGAGSLSNKKKSNNEFGLTMDDPVIMEEDNVDEYYMQLMHLRQYWRVKKTGVQITGDVTYRSVGSHFWHPGSLEVKAAHGVTGSGEDQRKLVVNISPDLMQLSKLTVEILDHGLQHPWTAYTDLIPWRKSKTAFEWENNLQLAQLHLFNLEIFSLLSNDAFQGSYNNIEVLDSRIRCRVLDKVEVFITHHVGEEVDTEKAISQNFSANDLTLFLSNLMLQHHTRNIKSCSLHPATSNRQQKPMRSSPVHNLLNKSPTTHHNCMLKDFLEEAKHKVWVTRLMNFLDEKSKNLKNSMLIMHWNVMKYRMLSAVTILVVTKSYAITITTSILLTIDNTGFKVTFENAEKLTLPCDLGILQELLDLELKNHMIKIANSLCVQHGWFVIQSSPKYSAVTGSHKTCIENGSIFYSAKHHRFVKMFVYTIDDVEISLSVPIEGSLLYLDERFQWLNIAYNTLPWVSLPGRTFAEKIESLFLCN